MDHVFVNLRDRLDEQHSRRDRVFRAGRDITATSKKIIFALHRLSPDQTPVDRRPEPIVRDINKLHNDIYKSVASIQDILSDECSLEPGRERKRAASETIHAGDTREQQQEGTVSEDKQQQDLQPETRWLCGDNLHPKYAHYISSCVQELVEAVSFDYFLDQGRVITQEQLARRMPPSLPLSQADYILGLFDLTGELMKYAILHMREGGAQAGDTDPASAGRPSSTAANILKLLQQFDQSIQGAPVRAMSRGQGLKDLPQKVALFKTSVQKVEDAVCKVGLCSS